jgi:hypothetical protein
VPEAPNDTSYYGRHALSWSAVLPLTGGTLTGALAGTVATFASTLTTNQALVISNAAGTAHAIQGQTSGSNRWTMQLGNGGAEGGSNAGSDFALNRFSDAGSFIDSPLTINRASGNVTLTGQLSITANGLTAGTFVVGQSLFTDNAAGTSRVLFGRTSGSNRWAILAGDSTAESGSNAGSNFGINRYSDAGAFIDSPLLITRSSGLVTINSASNATLAITSPVTTNRMINFQTSTSSRWQMYTDNTAEGGSNAGSNFALLAVADNGASALGFAFTVVRSTQVVTFGKAIVNGPSDRTLKENIAPLEDSLDKVLALQGVSFSMKDDAAKRRQIGLVAQDVAPIVPEVIQDYRSAVPGPEADSEPVEVHKLALDYPKLVALLVEALKELNAKVTVLEAKLA